MGTSGEYHEYIGGIPQVQIQLLYIPSLFRIKEFCIRFVLS